MGSLTVRLMFAMHPVDSQALQGVSKKPREEGEPCTGAPGLEGQGLELVQVCLSLSFPLWSRASFGSLGPRFPHLLERCGTEHHLSTLPALTSSTISCLYTRRPRAPDSRSEALSVQDRYDDRVHIHGHRLYPAVRDVGDFLPS